MNLFQMDKGKKRQSMNEENTLYKDYNKERLKNSSSLKAQSDTWWEKERKKKVFANSMRRMFSREERKGKDWVKTKEESNDFGYYNWELMENVSKIEERLKTDFMEKKISEEDYQGHLEELQVYYNAKTGELLAAEDEKMKKYVERYEARQHEIGKKSGNKIEMERQIEMEAKTARERQLAKEIEEAEDENYAVDLSEF